MESAVSTHSDKHAIKRLPLPTPDYSSPRGDIFDTLEHWLTSPVLAYSSWIARQSLKESTKVVYIAMFGRFCQFLDEQGKRLDYLEAGDIRKFLDSANPNLPESRRFAQTGRQRQQYVRQLEKVFAHLASLGHGGTNPGRIAGYEKVGSGKDKPTRFLSAEESRAVMSIIQTRSDELSREEKSTEKWMEYRDLALIGVMIGAGLKVSHVERLTLNCMDMVEERIDLSRPGCAHRARILAFAVAPIKAWLSIQEQMHGSGRLPDNQKIFEAGRKSGFGRTCKTVTLSASSIHRRTQRLLAMAGITGDRASAQTLRNTYVGLLIEGGATDEHLVDYLGLQASVSADRLRAAYAKDSQQKADFFSPLATDQNP